VADEEAVPEFGTFDHMAAFTTLYDAHLTARRGKCRTREVLAFEVDGAAQLWSLSEALASGEYRPGPYSHFVVREPKVRQIFAPAYRDRVVQHALCDTVLRPALEPRLVFDNAACREGKGTHFALNRLAGFLREHYRRHGLDGYVLKFDIHHYFASIRHDVLLVRLGRVFRDARTMDLIERIVASYAVVPGVGLPLGNQASQWFALYYLDGLDRLIKERLRVPWYSRYMDDGVLLHPSRRYLRECLARMEEYVAGIGLEFNAKTQIFPVSAGVNYLGFHTYLTGSGRVVRRLDSGKKATLRRHLARLARDYAAGLETSHAVAARLRSHCAHLEHGDTYRLRQALLQDSTWLRHRGQGET
jgi:hypothetical protein